MLVAQLCTTLCDTMDCSLKGSSVHGDSPGQNTGVGSHSLLQGIFPTQGSNPGLPHCWWILYCLNHEGRPKILEWVVYPFSRGTSWPRDQTGVSCIAGRFFTNWAIREHTKGKHNYHERPRMGHFGVRQFVGFLLFVCLSKKYYFDLFGCVES